MSDTHESWTPGPCHWSPTGWARVGPDGKCSCEPVTDPIAHFMGRIEAAESALTAARERIAVLEGTLQPFKAFAEGSRRALEMLPDTQMTNGSPMAGPQLYGRDFVALLAALSDREGV